MVELHEMSQITGLKVNSLYKILTGRRDNPRVSRTYKKYIAKKNEVIEYCAKSYSAGLKRAGK